MAQLSKWRATRLVQSNNQNARFQACRHRHFIGIHVVWPITSKFYRNLSRFPFVHDGSTYETNYVCWKTVGCAEIGSSHINRIHGAILSNPSFRLELGVTKVY